MKYEIWIEKYRPKKLNDIVGQEFIINNFKRYVIIKGFPNLMLTGRPGTGKTTAAICLASELHGNLSNFKELNASDTRGIDVVRNAIKKYADTQPIGNVDFKILFLDECDALTSDAQSALRRTMEKFSSTCKFILGCNYSSKIIEPIQSRCAVYRFKTISKNVMTKRLLYIAEKEGLILNNETIDAIIYVAEGDLRKAINTLEMASMMNNKIDVDTIYKCNGLAHPDEIIRLLTLSLKGNYRGGFDILEYLLIEEGYSSLDILTQMFKEIKNLNIIDKMKVDLYNEIGECDFRISEGSSELIQMKAMISKIILIGQ